MAVLSEPASGPDDLTLFRRRNAGLLWSVALFSMVVNLLMLTGPIYMLQVYDRVLGSGSRETLVALTALIVFLFLMMAVLDHVRGRVAARYGARLQDSLDARVFGAALARAGQAGKRQTGLQDLAALQRLTGAPVFLALFDMPWTPLFLAAIFLFHPWLGWLATLGAVVLMTVTLANRALGSTPTARALAAARAADQVAVEMQTEAELIRALGMGDAALARWRRQRAGRSPPPSPERRGTVPGRGRRPG